MWPPKRPIRWWKSTPKPVSSSFYGGQRVSQSAGSGVILSADGYIVTNNHVVAGADSIAVRTRDGQSYTARLVGADSDTDLAVLKIEAGDLPPVVLGSSETLVVGETAVAIGNPLGELGGTVTSGIISALSREVTIDNQTMTLLQTNAAINPGNSGGGLFNSKGELIGVVNAKYAKEGVEGLGFAIPIDAAKPVIEQLISQGYVSGRVATGFTPIDLTDEAAAMRYRVSRTGVYVYQVTTSTDGFQSGDLASFHRWKEYCLYERLQRGTAGSPRGRPARRNGSSRQPAAEPYADPPGRQRIRRAGSGI